MRAFQVTVWVMAAVLPLSSTSIEAAELSWDTNGATPGSGNAGGSWAGNNWSTDATGAIATTGWTDGSDAVFSAGTDGTGTWAVDVAATNRSVRNVIVHEGNVTLGTSGSFLLSDAANWSAAAGSSLTVTRNIANGGHDLSFFSATNNGGAVTVGGVVSGTGSLNVTGPGTLTLATENTYEGGTVIDGGTLKLGHRFGIGKIVYSGTSAQAKGFTLKSGAFDINGQVTYTPIGGQGNWLILTPIILAGRAGEELSVIDSGGGGGFGLFKYGANEAKIIYDATDNPGTATISAPFSTSGYTSSSHTRYIDVGDSAATGIEVDFQGTLGQTGATDGQTTTIQKEGPGTMRISAANNFPRLHVAGGVLIANHDQALGASRTGGYTNLLTLQNGTLQAGGADRAFDTPVALYTGSTSTISGDDWNLTLSGNITGAGNLIKSGASTLVLSGVNTYTGNLAVNQGMLWIDSTAPLPGWNTAGRYSVADGATLAVGNGVLEAQVTAMLGTGNFQAGSRLGFDTTAGDRTHATAISGSIGVTKLGPGTLTMSGSSSYTGETVIDGGTLKLGHRFGIGSAGGHAKGFTLKNGTFDINGQSTYIGSWLLMSPMTLAGDAGAELTVAGAGGGFGLHSYLGNEGRIIYDATNHPGAATISAAFSASGASGDVYRYIVVGDSAATDVEIDFTGTLGQTGIADGRNTTIHKDGPGTMRISAANYFPRIEVAGGVLIANHDQALGISRAGDGGAPNRVTLSGGTLQAGGADRSYDAEVLLAAHSTISGDDANLTLSGRISGLGMNLLKAGTKTLTLSATNNSYGNTTISEGMLSITNAGALPGWNTTGRYSVADGATLAVGTGVTEAQVTAMLGTGSFQAGSRLGFDTTAGDRTHATAISGPIGVTKLGPGTLTMSGSSSYTGETVIDGGTLKLGHKFGIGSAGGHAKGFTLKNGTFDINGQSTYLGSWLLLSPMTLAGDAGAELTVAGTGGGFGLHNNLGGNEGRIIYDATNNPGTATVSAAFSTSGASGDVYRYIVVGDSAATDVEIDFTGTLGQTGIADGRNTTIHKDGPGTMRISAANYFPRIEVAGGVLIANHDQALGISRAGDGGAPNRVTLSGGTLQAGGADRAFDTPVELIGGGTISGDDWNLTLSGEISGSGNLIKSGASTLVLSGDNTYTGTTTINDGALLVTGSLANTPVAVESGATLGGTGSVGGAVAVNNGGTFSPGMSPGVLTVGALALASGSTTLMEINGLVRDDEYDGVDITSENGLAYGGTLSLDFGNTAWLGAGSVFDLFNFTGTTSGEFSEVTSTGYYSGDWAWDGADAFSLESGWQTLLFSHATGDLTIIPEPGALALLAAGLLGLLAYGRRKGTFRF